MGKASKVDSSAIREIAIIVLSILIAFGLDAGWESWLGSREETRILSDLTEEFRTNRSVLDTVLVDEREKMDRIQAVLLEAGPDRVGIEADSLASLLSTVTLSTTFDPRMGVLNQLLAGGDIRLISDPALRSRLAAFPSLLTDFEANQSYTTQLTLNPTVWLSTGPFLFQHPRLRLPVSATPTTWSDPPTPDQMAALKYLSWVFGITGTAMGQGEALRVEIDAILQMLEAA